MMQCPGVFVFNLNMFNKHHICAIEKFIDTKADTERAEILQSNRHVVRKGTCEVGCPSLSTGVNPEAEVLLSVVCFLSQA